MTIEGLFNQIRKVMSLNGHIDNTVFVETSCKSFAHKPEEVIHEVCVSIFVTPHQIETFRAIQPDILIEKVKDYYKYTQMNKEKGINVEIL